MDGGVDKGLGSRGGLGEAGRGKRTCVVFLLFRTQTNRKKIAFFEGCPVGVGGGTHRSWPGGRGGRPRALVAGEGWGLVGSSKEGQVQGRVGLVGSSTGAGKGSGAIQGLRFRLFFTGGVLQEKVGGLTS